MSASSAASAAAARAALTLSCATWVGMSTGTFCLAGSSADSSTCESAGDSAGSSAGEIAGCSAAAFAPPTPSTPSTRRTRSRAPHTQCACLPLICTPHVRRAVIGRFAAMVLFLCFNLAYVSWRSGKWARNHAANSPAPEPCACLLGDLLVQARPACIESRFHAVGDSVS